MRLDRFIAGLTELSRKDVKAALSKGRVTVNGIPERDSARNIDEHADTVTLDLRPLAYKKHIHIMMNKPAGILTATEDRHEKTVFDLLPPQLQSKGLTPIGRLDKDTTGLLLLTTDGQLAHRLISPRHHVDKEYIATTDGTPDSADIAAFAQGIALTDFTAMPAVLEVIGENQVRVVLHEGKYHQVKRMLASRGKPVTALTRVRMGSIKLDKTLDAGAWRELSAEEISALYGSAGTEEDV